MRRLALAVFLLPVLAAAKGPDLQNAQNAATIWLNAVLTQRIDALAPRTRTPLHQVGLQHSKKACVIPETLANRAALDAMIACLASDAAFMEALKQWRKVPFAWREASPKDAPGAKFETLAGDHTFVATVVQSAGFKATLVLAMSHDGAVGAQVDGLFALVSPPKR